MAKLKFEDEELEIADGKNIADAAEELGVLFSCRAGVCGVCQVKVIHGKENLNPANDLEKQMGCNVEEGERLACQCVIREGTVELTQ